MHSWSNHSPRFSVGHQGLWHDEVVLERGGAGQRSFTCLEPVQQRHVVQIDVLESASNGRNIKSFMRYCRKLESGREMTRSARLVECEHMHSVVACDSATSLDTRNCGELMPTYPELRDLPFLGVEVATHLYVSWKPESPPTNPPFIS